MATELREHVIKSGPNAGKVIRVPVKKPAAEKKPEATATTTTATEKKAEGGGMHPALAVALAAVGGLGLAFAWKRWIAPRLGAVPAQPVAAEAAGEFIGGED